jgi:hypothetical protein
MFVLPAVLLPAPARAAEAEPPWKPPPLRRQAELRQEWLKARLETHLPPLMRKHGVAMWLVICREYNEDPVFFSLVSPAVMAARRRTIYVFHDRGPEGGIERLALGGGSNGGLYAVYRDPANPAREIMGDAQWATLRKIVEQRRPASIGVNVSHTHAFADGLSAGEYQQLETALGPDWMKRTVRAEGLAVEFISLRVPGMLEVYRGMTEVVHWLLGRAFSREVITPGETTSQDVAWWLRQQAQDLGYSTWFHATVRVQKPAAQPVSLLAEDAGTVIARGDVLHVDFGLTAMRLNTDTQHMGYVLREGETGPPPGIRQALENAKRLQDLHLARLKPGLSGNRVLAEVLEAAKAEGIRGAVYSHPVGDHGHGAGPLIGLWDRQEGVPGKGDLTILPGTWFSIELNARTPVPEWDGKELWVGMEEDAVVTSSGAAWVLRRQEKFHLVR